MTKLQKAKQKITRQKGIKHRTSPVYLNAFHTR